MVVFVNAGLRAYLKYPSLLLLKDPVEMASVKLVDLADEDGTVAANVH